MVKMVKRISALALVMVLCINQLVIPALANTATTTNPDGSITVTVTESAKSETSNIVEQTSSTTKTETEVENIVQDVILNPDDQPVPQNPKEPEKLPENVSAEQGEWTNSGTAKNELTADGQPTKEALSEFVSKGDTQTTIIQADREMKKDDAADDVVLDFNIPNNPPENANKDTIVSENVVQIQITEDLSKEYLDKGYTVEPIYELDAEGNPTAKVIGLQATLKTVNKDNPTENKTGTVTATGSTTFGEASQGILVADTALDAEVTLGKQTISTGNPNEIKTSEVIKTGGDQPTYTRTTTTVTNTTSTGEPIALTEEEKAGLASSVRGESITSFVYLTKNEKPNETFADGSSNRYSYQYTEDADGNITSITETLEVLDANGNVKKHYSETQHYTTVTTTPITIVNPTTKEETTFTETTKIQTDTITNTLYTRTNTTPVERTDTTTNHYDIQQDTYTFIDNNNLLTDANGNRYFVYEGKMYAVVDEGSDTYTTNSSLNDPGDPNKKWEHTDCYLEGGTATMTTDGWNKTTTGTQLFKIEKDGEIRAVYCTELEQYTGYGNYTTEIFTDNTEDDGPAYWGNTIRQSISVAHNGYWGTDSGIGSLDSVKSLLRLYQDQINKDGVVLTNKDIEDLTAADALTATQVALWKYGASGESVFNDDFSTDSTIVILRNLLVDLAEKDAVNNVVENADGSTTYQGAAQELTGSSIIGAAINLKNQVVDALTGEPERSEQNNVLYNTDLIIKMSVSESSINGNLMVTVTGANGEKLGVYRLAEDGTDNLLTNAAVSLADSITNTKQVKANGDGTYTLKDLVLPSGMRFSVNISGTQHLDDGVTIYMNSTKQDFIGLVSKDKDVDLTFDIEFSAAAPKTELVSGSYTQTGTIQQKYTGISTQEQSKTDVVVSTTGSLTTKEAVLTTFKGDVSVLKETYSETSKESRLETPLPEESNTVSGRTIRSAMRPIKETFNNPYKMHFVLNDIDAEIENLSVFFGETIGSLPQPTRPGYVFKGWYWDSDYKEMVDGTSDYPLEGDCKVYAKWVKEEVVTLYIQNKSTSEAEPVEVILNGYAKGDKVVLKEIPLDDYFNSGYRVKLLGYYDDGGKEINDSIIVEGKTNIYVDIEETEIPLDIPKTGDSFNLMLYASIVVISAIGLVIACYFYRKSRPKCIWFDDDYFYRR